MDSLTWRFTLVALLAFAAGVLSMDMAQEARAQTAEAGAAPSTTTRPSPAGLPALDRAALLDLLCQHYRATGQSFRCVQA